MVDIDTLADVVAFTERLVEALRQPIRAADKEFGGRRMLREFGCPQAQGVLA